MNKLYCTKCGIELNNCNWTLYCQKEKRHICKNCKSLATKNSVIKNPINCWSQTKLRDHKKKGFIIHFSLKEFREWIYKQNYKYCKICNKEIDYSQHIGYKGNNGASLDRINNENELRLDNIQIVCCKCNSTKLNRTMKEFIDYCKIITEKFKD